MDDIKKTIEYLKKHLTTPTQNGDRGQETAAYGNLGNACQSLGEYRKAIESHEKHSENNTIIIIVISTSSEKFISAMHKIIKDVSRVRHCVLRFSVVRIENRLYGRKQKNEC